MKRSLIGIFFCLLLLWSGCHFRDRITELVLAAFAPLDDEPVPTILLEREDYRIQVAAVGELTGLNTVALSVPRILRGSMKIDWLIDEGAIVQPGDVVVRFDSSEALLELETNENSVSIYRQNIQKAKGDFESEVKQLNLDQTIADLELDFSESQIRKDEDIFSRWEIQESIISAALVRYRMQQLTRQREARENLSEADLRILGIARRRAESEAEIARQTLNSLEISAPFEGVVLYRRVGLTQLQVGSDVWSGQSVVDLANLRQYQGRLFLVETDIVGVEPGQSVDVFTQALENRAFSGKIEKISAAPRQVSRYDPRRYFQCDVVLEVPIEVLGDLKPGMRLEGMINLGFRENALVVPKSAVIKEESAFVVYLKTGDDYLRQEVEILDGDYGFYLIEGVEENQEICLRHPYEKQQLQLPDFNSPTISTRSRRFVGF